MNTHQFDAAPIGSRHLSISHEVEESHPTVHDAAAVGGPDVLNAGALVNLQRLAGNSAVSSLLSEQVVEQSPVQEVVNSGEGTQLDNATRTYMEDRLGHDFGNVRIHTGPQADQAARAVNAQAYTIGHDVGFRDGKYAPDTSSGLRIIAHELTHVIQQDSGPVTGSPGPGGIQISDPSDRFELEAERTADRVLAGEGIPAHLQPPPLVQRDLSDEERKDQEDQVQTAKLEGPQTDEDEYEEPPT